MEIKSYFADIEHESIAEHPEIFPPELSAGYRFYGGVKSKKLGVKTRRIQLVATKEVYQLRPSSVMPYMIGKTDELEKPLYLRRFGVPFDARAYVFGKNAMYWYRATAALGRFSIVGTTVKSRLPPAAERALQFKINQ